MAIQDTTDNIHLVLRGGQSLNTAFQSDSARSRLLEQNARGQVFVIK